MKKSFTLIEVVISITLFSIILIFMYKTLDLTKHTNKIFDAKIKSNIDINKFKQIIIEDILESKSINRIKKINDFYILELRTNNMYHNVFYKYVYYLVSKKNNLFRIESKNIINFNELEKNVLSNTYIDLLISDVEKFELARFKNHYVHSGAVTILFKQKAKKSLLINSLTFTKSNN